MAYKLLLADDSITIQKVVELTLSEEGFDVTAVGDGEAALEAARKLVPDVILADVFMPKMDGYELCEKVKSDSQLKEIPVMLLAGTFEEFDESRAARVGASDNLTKPFESTDLISRVRSLVENRPAQPAAAPAPEAGLTAAEEVEGAEPAAEAVDDLWSVVDMASDEQPLAGATEILQEDDLWRRANLLNEPEEEVAEPLEEIPFEELPAEPLEEFGEAEEFIDAADMPEVEPYAPPLAAEEYETDKTAILNMDDIHASIHGETAGMPHAVDVAQVEEQEITTFENLGAATDATEYAPPPRPAQPPSAGPALSEDALREQVEKIVGAEINARIKQALSSMTADMIEKIVWDVVPELAEEIIQKEVDRIKAGMR